MATVFQRAVLTPPYHPSGKGAVIHVMAYEDNAYEQTYGPFLHDKRALCGEMPDPNWRKAKWVSVPATCSACLIAQQQID